MLGQRFISSGYSLSILLENTMKDILGLILVSKELGVFHPLRFALCR